MTLTVHKSLKIKIEHLPDERSDDDLGKFASARDVGFKDWYIDRATGEIWCGLKSQGGSLVSKGKDGVSVDRNSHPYFIPDVENYAGCTTREQIKYCRQDWARAESLNNGEWNYIGVRAVATAEIGGAEWTAHSSGLWGVESDSGAKYLAELANEQLAELEPALVETGFSKTAIRKAVKACTA